MRVYPPVSKDATREWLIRLAIDTLGAERTTELDELAGSLAEAMEAVSKADVPEHVEPLFP